MMLRWRRLLGGLALVLATGLASQPMAEARREATVQVAPMAVLEGVGLANHDGDTLRVQISPERVERVRLLGVDTAEMAQGAWADRARAFTSALTHGKRLRLECDRQPRDRYRRLLAYVYVGSHFVNLELVEAGLATVLDYAPNHAHAQALAQAEARAKAGQVGIWHPTTGLRELPRAFRHRGVHPSPRPRASRSPRD